MDRIQGPYTSQSQKEQLCWCPYYVEQSLEHQKANYGRTDWAGVEERAPRYTCKALAPNSMDHQRVEQNGT